MSGWCRDDNAQEEKNLEFPWPIRSVAQPYRCPILTSQSGAHAADQVSFPESCGFLAMIANLAHTVRETLSSVPPFNAILRNLSELEKKRGVRPEEAELCFFYAGGARAKKERVLGILRRIREAGAKRYRPSLLGEPDLAIPIVECVPTRYDKKSPIELEPELQRELCCGGLTGMRVGVVRRKHVNSFFQGWVEERFAKVRGVVGWVLAGGGVGWVWAGGAVCWWCLGVWRVPLLSLTRATCSRPVASSPRLSPSMSLS